MRERNPVWCFLDLLDRRLPKALVDDFLLLNVKQTTILYNNGRQSRITTKEENLHRFFQGFRGLNRFSEPRRNAWKSDALLTKLRIRRTSLADIGTWIEAALNYFSVNPRQVYMLVWISRWSTTGSSAWNCFCFARSRKDWWLKTAGFPGIPGIAWDASDGVVISI